MGMIVRPNKSLLAAAMRFAALADWNGTLGWGNNGLAPYKHSFPGADCGQGFIFTLIYKPGSPQVVQALRETGAALPKAVMVDRCIWNHQQNWGCPHAMDCKKVVMIHKDHSSHCKQTVF